MHARTYVPNREESTRRRLLPRPWRAIWLAAVAVGVVEAGNEARAIDYSVHTTDDGYAVSGHVTSSTPLDEGAAFMESATTGDVLEFELCQGQQDCCCWDDTAQCDPVGPVAWQDCDTDHCLDCCHQAQESHPRPHQSCCADNGDPQGQGICCRKGKKCAEKVTLAVVCASGESDCETNRIATLCDETIFGRDEANALPSCPGTGDRLDVQLTVGGVNGFPKNKVSDLANGLLDIFIKFDGGSARLGTGVTLRARIRSKPPSRVMICTEAGDNRGCYSGCDLLMDCSGDCLLPPDNTTLREVDNFLPVHLALLPLSEINKFPQAVSDILKKQDPPPKQIKWIKDVQDAIKVIQEGYEAQGLENVVIFGYGSPGHFRVGDDNLEDADIQSKFIAALKGKMKELTLYGCEVSQGPGQAFLQKLTRGLQIPVRTWEGRVYAFGNDETIEEKFRNRYYVDDDARKKVIPTASTWGLIAMGAALLCAGTVIVWRRHSGWARGTRAALANGSEP